MSDDLNSEYLTLQEFVAAARDELENGGWNYLVGGTETETTVARNRLALDRIALRPRILVDVGTIDCGSEYFSKPARLPILLAPVGGLEMFHPEAALEVARGADRFGVPMMLSSVSRRTKQEIRAATGNTLSYQLYVRGGGTYIEDEIEEAIAAGYDSFHFTVDSAVYSRRERDTVDRFEKPWRAYVDAEARRSQAALNWVTIGRIRKNYDIPIGLKGIMTAEDARIAIDHGIDAVYVSNHGGRQLDHGEGTLDVLADISAACAGNASVIVDGGICRGTDIVKAIALGADMVGIGRLYCYALAAAGAEGIARMLEILEDEVLCAMGMLGVIRLDALTADHVRRGAEAVRLPSVLSAFPLLPGDPGKF